MRKKKPLEVTAIPSDSESVDGLDNSDDEEEVLNSRTLTEQSVPILDNISDDEESRQNDVTESVQENSCNNEIWESVSKPRTDIQFSKSFGPNIPETQHLHLRYFLIYFLRIY